MPEILIPAYSKRQVMDWSLVLASQDIPTTIIHGPETGWGLLVGAQDHERAVAAIRQYRVENRHWAWRQPLPWSGATFHCGAAGWCLLLLAIHWWTVEYATPFRFTARLDSAAVANGQWWRVFTAMLLHADVAHLFANVTTGLLLWGLAMARYGPGPGLLAAYLAGGAGNLAGILLYPKAYIGLGASGMVMGALGLISIPPLQQWSFRPAVLKQLAQGISAGLFLFVLFGVNPASDVIAHTGGFIAGALLGLVLTALGPKMRPTGSLSGLSWSALTTLVLLTAYLAAR